MRKLIVIAALALVAALVVGCSSGSGGGGQAGSTGGGAEDSSAGGGYARSNTGASLKGTVTSARPISSTVPDIGPRIVQTASLRLSIHRGRFDETVDDARSIAAGLGGFVVSSSAAQGTARRLVRGTLVIRVPGASYAEAMKSLAALGRVEGRQESGQDVSQEYVDLKSRVRQLQAVEAQLLELLQRAKTVGAALAVQQQLSQVQLDLEQAKGRLNYLDDQVALATISLDIHEGLVPAQKRDGGGFGIVDAWSKAADGFLAVIGWTFVVLATAAPLLILLGLAILVGRMVRRRLAQA
jgi:uncharacterized protein DUF4349